MENWFQNNYQVIWCKAWGKIQNPKLMLVTNKEKYRDGGGNQTGHVSEHISRRLEKGYENEEWISKKL